MHEEYYHSIDAFINVVKTHQDWWIGSTAYEVSTWRHPIDKFDLSISHRIGLINLSTYTIFHRDFKIIKYDRYPIFISDKALNLYIKTPSHIPREHKPKHEIKYEIIGDMNIFIEIATVIILQQ